MIIVRLAGGLGNQIFQLGSELLLAQKINAKRLILDDSALGNYGAKRENELLSFFDFEKMDRAVEFRNLFLTKVRLPRLLLLNTFSFSLVSDKNFQNSLNKPNKYFMLLDGYFQECLTQENFDEEILLLKNILIPNKFEINDGCVVHIRGGDFVKLGWNSVAPAEYYINAMQYMNKKFGKDKFYIVTDDRKYAESILKDLDFDYEFIGKSMKEDFYLIGSFQYRILSSSTFALWASALGNNENSLVVAPEYWTPDVKRKIYLPNEIRI